MLQMTFYHSPYRQSQHHPYDPSQPIPSPHFQDESYLDMATAVSGSGPAYVFLTMEAMIDAAVHVGFPRDIAVKLVTATIRGSATYAQQSGDSIPTLRNQVTSPGTHSFHYNLILDMYFSYCPSQSYPILPSYPVN